MRRFETLAGILSPATILATFGVGASLSTVFSWPTDPFSVIGTTGDAAAMAFNAGLIGGGALAIPFAIRLWRSGRRAVGALYAVVGATFAGAGAFPAGGVAHALFGLGAFLGIWLCLWTDGILAWRRGDRRNGGVGLALGSVAVLVWLPYDLGLTWAQVGFGAAELLAVLAFAAWSVWTASRLRRPPTASETTDADDGPLAN